MLKWKNKDRSTKRKIIIGDEKFDSIIECAKFFNVTSSAINGWAKKGFSPEGKKVIKLDKYRAE